MKLEDKKRLVEWMGWDVFEHEEEHEGFSEPTGEDCIWKNDGFFCFLKEWNPDTNHEQFKEVWNKLTIGMKEHICRSLEIDRKFDYVEIGLAELILNDLPKVMDAVMEIIKIEVPA